MSPVSCPLDGAYTRFSVPRLTHLHGGVGVSAMPGYETLRKGRDIDRVFNSGRWYRMHPVSVSILARDDVEPVRVCFIAGRRIGNAVARNRGRRRMREAFRAASQGLAPGADVVLLAQPSALTVDFSMLVAAVRRALTEGGLLDAGGGKG